MGQIMAKFTEWQGEIVLRLRWKWMYKSFMEILLNIETFKYTQIQNGSVWSIEQKFSRRSHSTLNEVSSAMQPYSLDWSRKVERENNWWDEAVWIET